MVDRRAALDVQTPAHRLDLIPLLDALMDDFHPFAIEQLGTLKRRVYFFSRDDRDNATLAILGAYDSSGVTVFPINVLDENWAERSQAGLRAIRVGRVTVATPWDIPHDQDAATLVIIRPSMGFGTGHHASTRVCLHALQALSLNNRTVIDIGTGSGILAIAAAKLGAAAVVGLDTDLDAVETAQNNVQLNTVSHLAQIRHGDIRQANGLDPAWVVLANINATLVCEHARALFRAVQNKGTLIIGGVTESEEPNVRQTLEPHGALTSRHTEDEWVALTLTLKRSLPD